MRGLKQTPKVIYRCKKKSHLLQMRGLKHFCLDREHHRHESHLLQMRGLKHTKDADNQIRYVASFTDAWIETSVETRFTDTR